MFFKHFSSAGQIAPRGPGPVPALQGAGPLQTAAGGAEACAPICGNRQAAGHRSGMRCSEHNCPRRYLRAK